MEKKNPNINIASFLLETLASPNEKTWHETGGPITQTINHSSLNPNHWRLVENTWKNNLFYRERGEVNGNNITKKHVRRYLISSCLRKKSHC